MHFKDYPELELMLKVLAAIILILAPVDEVLLIRLFITHPPVNSLEWKYAIGLLGFFLISWIWILSGVRKHFGWFQKAKKKKGMGLDE